MAKLDTLFMTKMAEKPYYLGPHIPSYIAHIRKYPHDLTAVHKNNK